MYRPNLSLAPVIVAIALAGPALAQDGFVPPSWIAPPSPDLAAQLTPGFAAMIGQSGRATVECLAEADGHAFSCAVTSESPAGLGFGSAARLVVASGQVRAARLDGRPVPRWVTTTVHFTAADLDHPPEVWTGAEPAAEALALAERVVETDPTYRAFTIDRLLNGLDFDRRPIVRGWIVELLPDYEQSMVDSLALQTARVFSESELRAMLAGDPVTGPDPEQFELALPEFTSEELAAVRELRRRYCDRWACDPSQ